jgi:hypothetical protein
LLLQLSQERVLSSLQLAIELSHYPPQLLVVLAQGGPFLLRLLPPALSLIQHNPILLVCPSEGLPNPLHLLLQHPELALILGLLLLELSPDPPELLAQPLVKARRLLRVLQPGHQLPVLLPEQGVFLVGPDPGLLHLLLQPAVLSPQAVPLAGQPLRLLGAGVH